MDTNEISISGIIGFPWNDSGTDVEDELPSPVAPPDTIMSPPFTPEDASDLFGRDTNYNLDLADVFQDVTVLPALVTPLEVTDATVAETAATYNPPWSRRDVLTSAGLCYGGEFPPVVAGAPRAPNGYVDRFADWS